MQLAEQERQCLIGALDSLGVALAEHDHEWSVGERVIYEDAINLLTASSCRKAADYAAPTTYPASQPANKLTQVCDPTSTRSRGLEYSVRRDAASLAWRWASKLCHCYEWIYSCCRYFLTAPTVQAGAGGAGNQQPKRR
jgi:hypothetical protein